MKYRELINKYVELCHNNGKEEGVVKLLLLDVTRFSATEMYLNIEEEVRPEILSKFEFLILEHIHENVPIQHLMGYTYFFGNKFFVSKDCLIPRKETEELVENFLYLYDEIFDGQKISLVDIGTGSGCIGLTIKKELGDLCDVTLTDISESALEMAIKNQNQLEIKVDFKIGNMLDPVRNLKFDCLISNPPYIPDQEYVTELVKDHEPHVALFGSEDGMKFYRIILNECRQILNFPNIIGFEHAYNTREIMFQLARKTFPEAEIRQIKDLQRRDRMTFIINRKKDTI